MVRAACLARGIRTPDEDASSRNLTDGDARLSRHAAHAFVRTQLGVGMLLLPILLSGCPSGGSSGRPTGASSPASPSPTVSAAPASVAPAIAIDEYTRTLIRFLDARVAGSGAEAFICCDAAARASAEEGRLYRYGRYDLVGYRVTERHQDVRVSGGDPYFIVFAVYEAGAGEQSGQTTPEFDEFVVVGDAVPGSLKVKKWSDEGTS